jgi:hypothetical protein
MPLGGQCDPGSPDFDPIIATVGCPDPTGGIVYPGTHVGIGALRWGINPIPASIQTLPPATSTDPSKLGRNTVDASTLPQQPLPAPGGSAGPGSFTAVTGWAAKSFVAHPWIWFFAALLLLFWLLSGKVRV